MTPRNPAAESQRRRRLLLLATALVAGAALVAALLLAVGPPDHPGRGNGVAVVQVQPGDSTSAISDMLVEHGVVASRGAKAITCTINSTSFGCARNSD